MKINENLLTAADGLTTGHPVIVVDGIAFPVGVQGAGGGGGDLPSVSFTAKDLKKGATALNTLGAVVAGTMPETQITVLGAVVSATSGYVSSGAIATIPDATYSMSVKDSERKVEVSVTSGGYMATGETSSLSLPSPTFSSTTGTTVSASSATVKKTVSSGGYLKKGDTVSVDIARGSATLSGNVFKVSSGYHPASSITMLGADVAVAGANVNVLSAGYARVGTLATIPDAVVNVSGAQVTVTSGGYVSSGAIATIPSAEITSTTTAIRIGAGYVSSAVEFPISYSGDAQYGVVDDNGNFQPLDMTVSPPVNSGTALEATYRTIATGLPYPDGEEVTPGGGGGENNYYVCTSILSDTAWEGYKVVVADNTLGVEGDAVQCVIENNVPTMGKIYDNKAQWLLTLAQPVIDVSPQENIGGQVNDKIGLKLNAKAENKSDDEISYTLVSAPEWMSFSNRVLSGTPAQSGVYSATIKVETDKFISVMVTVNVSVIAEKTDAIFYLPLRSQQTRAETGQYLVTGKGVYNASQNWDYLQPEYVTYDGYKCAKFVAGYTWDDDTGEEYSFITSVETNELANIEDTAQRSVAFLACPQRFYGESEWGDDTNSGGAAVEWGQGGQHLMFKVCPAYSYVYDEETGEENFKHIVAVSLWNGDIDIDTGLPCDNKMHHYALSMDCTGSNAGTMKLYVDGSEVWSGWFSWGTPHTVNSPISIGKMYGDNGYNYEGYLAEVKVWDRIITADEAAAEYNRVKALKS